MNSISKPPCQQEAGPLRQRLLGSGLSLNDATVLARQNDPFRTDTPAGHRDGQWFAAEFERARALKGVAVLHIRGLHYALLGRKRPDGRTYINDHAALGWLAKAAKAARFLGYIGFDQIIDERNAEPTIYMRSATTPEPWVSIGLHVDIPDADELVPEVGIRNFVGRQPYHLVIFGEKSSLAHVVMPVAASFEADVYLPGGEISDTLLYQMAASGAADTRPLVVFTLSDCDPGGRQMPVSIGRKLQAFKDLEFPDLRFEVRPTALLIEHARDLDLPLSPLKETERRADKWREIFGIEQVEIDALGTLRPNLLRLILTEAIDPFFDHTLALRVEVARREWRAMAQADLDQQVDAEMLEELRAEAAEKLEDMRDEIEKLNEGLRLAAGDQWTLPTPDIPKAEASGAGAPPPLISSDWSWPEQVRALKAWKAYEDDDAEGDDE